MSKPAERAFWVTLERTDTVRASVRVLATSVGAAKRRAKKLAYDHDKAREGESPPRNGWEAERYGKDRVVKVEDG
jgi:hypothetical protein